MYVCAAEALTKGERELTVASVTASSTEEAVTKIYFLHKTNYPNSIVVNYVIDDIPIETLQKFITKYNKENSKHPYPIITLN